VAQGIAMGLDRPVVGVSSLLALAELCGKEAVLPAIDARMGQVYWALLCQDEAAPTGWTCRQPEQVSDPASVAALALSGVGVGSGWDRYPDVLSRLSSDWIAQRFPDATAIASIAVREIAAVGIEKCENAAPVYLRDQVTG
jgi:tRNA threonylcarbamoyladenosine biosynthesis protein TsaB